MPLITKDFDTLLVIFQRNDESTLIGYFSPYRDIPHPGSGNKIEGWRWDQRSWPGEDSDYASSVPLITDADLSDVDYTNFQSGIGNEHDLEVKSLSAQYITENTIDWAPVINHGTFFDFNVEGYLFGDGLRSQFIYDNDITTLNFNKIALEEKPKLGVPIRVTTFRWDRAKEKYVSFRSFRERKYFTGTLDINLVELPTYNFDTELIIFANVDTSSPEFVIDIVDDINYLILNGHYNDLIGNNVAVFNDLLTLEDLGTGDDSDNQLFHTRYSPIDTTELIEVYSYTTGPAYTTWNIVSDFTPGGAPNEVRINSTLGLVIFGNTDNNDDIPATGETIVIRYTTSVQVDYEPEFTPDTFTAIEPQADVNPIRHTRNKGFILLQNYQQSPASIVLEADLPLLSFNQYGPIYLNSIFSNVFATVLDKQGNPIENIDVTFHIQDTPPIGQWSNGLGDITTTTDSDGIANTFYNSPNTVDDIGEIIDATGFSTGGGNTTFTTSSIQVSTQARDIYLYKIWKDDPVMGIPLYPPGDQSVLDAGNLTPLLEAFYESYFLAESIYGPLGSPAATSGARWEHTHRLIRHMLTPAPYNNNFRNGRKQLVATYDSTAINPKLSIDAGSSVYGAFRPLQPITIVTDIGGDSTNNEVTYTGILDTPGVGDLHAYLLISPTPVTIIASVFNRVTNQTIYSNEIEIQIEIAPSQNGTVYVESFNDIPVDLLGYALTGADNGKFIPLGWRIRDTNITLAAALNGVTYVGLNPGIASLGHAYDII